jgi:hypothetical protein
MKVRPFEIKVEPATSIDPLHNEFVRITGTWVKDGEKRTSMAIIHERDMFGIGIHIIIRIVQTILEVVGGKE